MFLKRPDGTGATPSQDCLPGGQNEHSGQQVLGTFPQDPPAERVCMAFDDQQFFTAWERGLVRGLSAMLRAQQIRRANSS